MTTVPEIQGMLDTKWYPTLYEQLPNLKADLREDSGMSLWREFKPQRGVWEFTLYYIVDDPYNGTVKKRVDWEVDTSLIELGTEHVTPEDCRITYWGDARRAVV